MSPDLKKTILLVEDEVIIAMTEKMQLEKYGYAVVTAHNGEIAVGKVESVPGIDLVLMDIDLGSGIDGTEAAARILKDHDLPVVFLSSHTDPVIVGKTERITSYGYVVKNSSTTVLDASIKMAFKLFDSNRKFKETEKHLESIIESTSDLIWSVNPVDFGLIFFNQGLSDYFLNKRNILLQPGMRPKDLFPNDVFIKKWEGFYQNALENGSYKIEYPAYSGDTILELTISVIRTEGVLLGLSVFAKDITDRKLTEKALQEREERFKKLLKNIPSVAVQGYGPEGATQYWNKASEILYGYSEQEAIGRNLVDLIIPPEMRGAVEGAIKEMAVTGVAIPPARLSLMRKDGSRVDVFSSHALVRIPGRAQELFCIDIDFKGCLEDTAGRS
jgi:PAS domain S-box-containing protein